MLLHHYSCKDKDIDRNFFLCLGGNKSAKKQTKIFSLVNQKFIFSFILNNNFFD